MKNAEAVLSVKFTSTHAADELAKICQEDLEAFRSVPGLVQKYYFSEEVTGAISGVYFFQSRNAREAFWISDLAKSIPSRYAAIPGSLRAEKYEVAIVLNDAELV